MDEVWTSNRSREYQPSDQTSSPRDLYTQLVISIALGLSAFTTFCFLRPRWTGFYAARKKQKDAASALPDLPDSFFGWIPALYRITEEEVLASAGLDAFVFLSFFRMAIKFLAIALFFSLVVILPVHVHNTGDYGFPGNATDTSPETRFAYLDPTWVMDPEHSILSEPQKGKPKLPTRYLWMYVVFSYFFTAVLLYLMVSETKKIIRIRQDYLGTQSTVTDRTIRLSGIPPDLRSEVRIKKFIEKLEIGKVESVTLCRNWRELDKLMLERKNLLRRLEVAWTLHLGPGTVNTSLQSLPVSDPDSSEVRANQDEDGEESNLLGAVHDQNPETPSARERPTTRLWYGFLNLQSKKIDAIDYYEEKLRRLDDKIKALRQQEFTPKPLAFVTMDSVATCQMAVQAILDPSPMQLLANLAPAPPDVVWKNTYLSRSNRMIRSWSITTFIVLLTVFWSVLLLPAAGLLNLESIHRFWPQLADALEIHPIVSSLVQTGLPTLYISLLNVAVPYLYDWLSNLQGMTSQGDVELSVISKNFFFTFFNLFLVFTIFGTASNFYGLVDNFRDSLKDTTRVAYTLARSLEALAPFYVNLIVLQGLGLFPFRLLEFGSMALYPIGLFGARTPRDYAQLVQPPVFSYGFYLPQTILIFIICIVYSILSTSWLVLLFGLVYFLIGSFTYKYQLLYAMDHRQHSTGRAWPIICYRVMVGLLVFQVSMAGVLALKSAYKRSILLVPLILGTVWFSYFFARTFEPLTSFIALRSIHRSEHPGVFGGEDSVAFNSLDAPPAPAHGNGGAAARRRRKTIDEQRETGLHFVNPNLISPLEEVWLANKSAARSANGSNNHTALDDGDENV
ncbi:MAG: hypothetical protein M1819_004408 [Sarea resinae]|nr:MAG: hypothetical protein M1819_004408 [Sarea resinae]